MQEDIKEDVKDCWSLQRLWRRFVQRRFVQKCL